MRDVFWASDIVLLPSRFEGFGLVVAEGMSCGCVPIRTPSAGWKDQIIEGQTGFVVPFNDSDLMAERIEALADKQLLQLMRNKAHLHADRLFRREVMAKATSNLYRNVSNEPTNTMPGL